MGPIQGRLERHMSSRHLNLELLQFFTSENRRLNVFSRGISNIVLSTSILHCLCSTDRLQRHWPFVIEMLQPQPSDQPRDSSPFPLHKRASRPIGHRLLLLLGPRDATSSMDRCLMQRAAYSKSSHGWVEQDNRSGYFGTSSSSLNLRQSWRCA
jgi:hypothetical protein